MVRWDGTTQILWNALWTVIWAGAVVSALRTPKSSFAAMGWGKYWLTFWIVFTAITVDGYLLLPMTLVWWLYWRPRIRRLPLAPTTPAVPTP
jgi:hypothetical protein